MVEKDNFRKYIRLKKNTLSDEEKISASDKVFNFLFSTKEWVDSKHVLLYHSLPDELPTHEYLGIINNIKQIYLPRVNGNTLEILKYDKECLSSGAFNIAEPTGLDVVELSKIDIIVVPGMAFDKSCNRLGRGKGYYDSLLKNANAIKIGICYDFQLFESIPTEPHDIKMDIVITPSHIYRKQ